MKAILQLCLLSALIQIVIGCASSKKLSTDLDSDNEEAFVARSENLIQQLDGEYQSRLRAKLKEDGAEKAMAECHIKNENGVHKVDGKKLMVGRTSHKLRNPLNAPEPWMAEYFADFKGSSQSSPKDAVAIALAEGRHAYLKPIYMKSQCLNCHGSQLSSSVQSKLNEKYLQDGSTGFSEGDFAGFYWVQVAP